MGFDVIHGGNPLLLGAGAFLSGQGKGLARAADYAHDDNMQARDMMARQQQQIFGHLSQIAAQKLAHIDALDMTNANHINALEKMDVAHQYAVDEHYQERYNRPYKELVMEAQKANMPFPEYVQQLDTKIAETQYMAKLKAQNMEIGLLPQEQAHNDAIQLRINQWKKNIEREFTPEEAAKGIAYKESQLIQPHPVPRKSIPTKERFQMEVVPVDGGWFSLGSQGWDFHKSDGGSADLMRRDAEEMAQIGQGQPMWAPGMSPGEELASSKPIVTINGIDYVRDPETGKRVPDNKAAMVRQKDRELDIRSKEAEQKRVDDLVKEELDIRDTALKRLDALKKTKRAGAEPDWDYSQKDIDTYMANERAAREEARRRVTGGSSQQYTAATPEQIARLRAVANGNDPAAAARARELLQKYGQ